MAHAIVTKCICAVTNAHAYGQEGKKVSSRYLYLVERPLSPPVGLFELIGHRREASALLVIDCLDLLDFLFSG